MELKPCPFCGGKAALLSDRRGQYWGGKCVDCGVQDDCTEPFSKAAERWNHRPIEDALRAELAAARAELADTKVAMEALSESGSRCIALHFADLRAVQAELEDERARLDRLLEEHVWPTRMLGGEDEGKRILVARACAYEIPTGQTARDVIDRLIGEAGDAT